jgi:hypothetical protein
MSDLAISSNDTTSFFDGMPLLTQYWDDRTNRVVALTASLSEGVATSTIRASWFLGSFCLGAIAWESITTIPFDFRVYIGALTGKGPPRDGFFVAANCLAALARAAALAFLAVYFAYTHGAQQISCAAWPNALVSTAAAALCAASATFVSKAIGMARLSLCMLLILGFLVVTQVIVMFSSIAAWQGGLRPSGLACYLRIQRWFGIFR